MIIGVMFGLFVGALPLLLATYLVCLYIYRHSKKVLITLLSIPVILIMFIGGMFVYETNYHFVNNTDISYELHEQFKVGDSIEDVKNFYGENYYSTVEQGMDAIGYVDRDRKINLVFWHYQGEVYQIWVRRID